ncbi:MAG TPA: hypothetical protein VFQ91_10500 [Bryobacteraceae bacterium]|nr:hypothetical protein [Bryobacteraceae bacterium]
MMTRSHELSAELRHEIRQLANVVHERLLGRELETLELEFARWRSGELDAFELSALLHRFHEGTPRRLWLEFNTNRMAELTVRLCDSLRTGILDTGEVSAELLAHLQPSG